MNDIYLKILSDIHCEVYIDNEFITVSLKDTLTKIALRKGEYLVRLVSTVNAKYSIDQIINLEYDKVLRVDFIHLVRSNPDHLRVTDVTWLKDVCSIKNLVTGEIFSVPYDYVYVRHHGKCISGMKSGLGMVRFDGKEILPCKYNEISYFANDIIKVRSKGKYKLINSRTGEEYNSHEYDKLDWFEDRLPVGYRDGQCILFDNQGKEILQYSCYDFSNGFTQNGYAEVRRNGKYGLIYINGYEIIPCRYDVLHEFIDGLAHVKRDGKCGYVNLKGEEIIPCIYDFSRGFINGFSLVEKNGKCGFIDKRGRVVVPLIYEDKDFTKDFNEYGVAIVCRNGKYGCVNRAGKEICPCTLDWVHVFNKDKMAVYRNKEWMIIDSKGKIEKLKYEYVGTLTNGLALVEYNGLYGYIDENCKEVIPCIYKDGRSFDDGIAVVRKDAYYGCIDTSGDVIVPTVYKWMLPLIGGLIVAMKSTFWKCGIVRNDGAEIIPCEYSFSKLDEETNFREYKEFVKGKLTGEGRLCVMKNGKYGFINSEGEEVIRCVYDYAADFENGIAKVRMNGDYMSIDKHGNVL